VTGRGGSPWKLHWFGLAGLLALFLLYLAWLGPTAYFGWYHDDTIYFSSARALAEGGGYVLPSVPGAPPQTKYPPLHPWLLSLVWRWQPGFPDNLAVAVGLTAVFACWFLAAAFQLLRGLAGVGRWAALVAVALSAFHPDFVFLSGVLLSDVPFLALALTGALAADAGLRAQCRPRMALVAGVAAGLSALTRTLGLPVMAGIVACGLYRRAYRQCLVFSLAAFPLAGAALLSPGIPENVASWAAQGGPGFRQTWLFCTSYWEFWKLGVPNLDALWAMLSRNINLFAQGPARQCLFPPPGGEDSYAGTLVMVTLTAGILSGIARQARGQEWKPIHFLLVFYPAAAVLWNYALVDRFLMLFVPLFYAGLWVEGRYVVSLVADQFRPGRPLAGRILAGMLSAGLLAVAVASARHYATGVRPQLQGLAERRAALAGEKAELHDWIRRETGPEVRFIAYEDASLYLYTGRQSMRPIAFSTEAFYKRDEKVLERDLDRITDVARHIGARYWVAAADDFHLETGRPLIDRRIAELKSRMPVVFESSGGRVKLYDLERLIPPAP